MWISKALFQWNPNKKHEPMLKEDNLTLRYYSPEPTRLPSSTPSAEKFFSRPLLMWFPRKLFAVTLQCPYGCANGTMISRGLHQKTRLVVGVKGCYNVATEEVSCSVCHKGVLSW
jgi:hypothetical protein